MIPSFAVDRTEVVLHQLTELRRTGRLPADVPVYVDSPMALATLQIYREAFADGSARTEAGRSGRIGGREGVARRAGRPASRWSLPLGDRRAP
ncbi:hypothetical protein ACFYUY_27720 [Kitasatospora sp. NPDC004745]|uniref:hypothetical protein n=1 Tax=Kitasatospora sp. NPDC004745 TaxID=3364019 RepID=UPI0036A39438